jgi:elongation factor G
MRVLDGAVAVFDGKEGVEAQSETVWRQADRYGVPRICFINKMDKLGADFEFSFNTIKERLGANPIAVQIPIGARHDFEGIIDLLEMKAYYFDAGDWARMVEKEIPDDMKEMAELWRHDLVEKAVELDDAPDGEVPRGRELDHPDEIRAALRKGTIARKCNPVFCGSALKNIGVQRLLDGVIDYLPNPTETPRGQGTDPKDPRRSSPARTTTDAPFSALVFKVVSDTHGDLTYVRVYSGTLEKGSARAQPGATARRRTSAASSRCTRRTAGPRQRSSAGQIVAVVGLKNSITGDTLCDPTTRSCSSGWTSPSR